MSETQEFFENADGNAAAAFTELQGNTQDFLLQDYNVKEVEEEQIPKLDEFDTSGPEYSGITEIVSDPDAVGAEDTTASITICLSTYHTQSAVNGAASKQSWICRSPNYLGDVWSAIKELGYTKEQTYFGEENVNAFLKEAYSRCKKGPAEGGSITALMIQELQEVIGKTDEDGLRGSRKVVNGYSYQKNGYSIENAILNMASKKLENADFKVVIGKSGSGNAVDFSERATTALDAGAALHIVIWSRANSQREGTGWFTVYRDSGNNEEESQEASEAISGKLNKECSVESAISDQSISTGSHFGDEEYYTVLNWSEVPTIILVVGSYADSDMASKLGNNSVQTEYANAICAAVSDLYKN